MIGELLVALAFLILAAKAAHRAVRRYTRRTVLQFIPRASAR